MDIKEETWQAGLNRFVICETYTWKHEILH